MDIDPLKPKNVPLAADIVLWFEFLLNPQLLTNHLNNPNAGKQKSCMKSNSLFFLIYNGQI